MTNHPGRMVRDPSAEQIDLCQWTFFAEDDPTGGVRDLLMKGSAVEITRVLRKQFDDDPPLLEFADDNKNFANDPALLSVILPLAECGSDDGGVVYLCSLEGPVDYLIWGTNKATCAKVAARLRELADKLDRAHSETNAA